ncbi:unnamed protein product [Mytilus coruscus]|uniref:CARD domain-containing protein n=1 Tax=Mytilus coruscus TaxID=42192 RepID=A0A6J8DFN0_MYTCO|nr:unnamed protein product [Mytilus coruscus]
MNSVIVSGEFDVLKLSEADDEIFEDVMKKVGMAKRPLHVHQFKNTLLEWIKDPGKNENVPSYIRKADDVTLSPATARRLKLSSGSDIYSEPKRLIKDEYEQQTNQNVTPTSYKSEKKKIQPQQDTTPKQTERVAKDQTQHGLCLYYDDLLNITVLDKIVLDNLISSCILMIEDREEIIKPTTQRERNKVLLDILTERPYGTFQAFKDILKASDPHNSDVQELCCKMQCTESSDEQISCLDIHVEENAVKIQKNYKSLVHNIVSTTDVTDYLIGEDILQHEDREEICASGLTTNESNRRLLDKLLYKDRNAYFKFMEALMHADFKLMVHEVSNTEVTIQDKIFCQIGKYFSNKYIFLLEDS